MSDNPTTAAVAEKPTEVTEVQVEASEPAAVSEKTEAAATEAKPVEGEAKATDGEPKAANGEKKAEESADKPTEETKENNSSFERRQNGDRGRGRGRGRGAPTTGQKRITNREERERRDKEFASLPETDDPVLIRQQVEFYLSDSNVATDWHVFKEMDGAKNRPIPIKHIHTFKRMRRFQPYSAVVKALRESEVLEVLDTDRYSGEGNEAVKRKVPVQLVEREGDRNVSLEEHHERLVRRSMNNLDASIYAKNFGSMDIGQIELENFFRPYGAVMVRMRRDADDKWKGSVFVEFPTPEAQKEFLALDPAPKFKDSQLTIMGKREYSKMKCDEKGITPNWEKDQNTRTFHKPYNRDRSDRSEGRGRGGQRGGGRGGRGNGRGRGRGNYGNRDRDDRNGRREENGNKRKAEGDDSGEAKKAKVEIKQDA